METVNPQVLAFPPAHPPSQPIPEAEYDKQIRLVLRHLSSVPAHKLRAGIANFGNTLEVVDPATHTIPYLYTLIAFLQPQNALHPESVIWGHAMDFICRFDPVQIRYCGHEWRRLMEVIARGAETSGNTSLAIEAIRLGILRVDPTSSTFTTVHLRLVKMCLSTRAYKAALPILDKDLYYLPSENERHSPYPLVCSERALSSNYMTAGAGFSDKLEYQHPLLYYLYGAMIYLALKNWARAALFLEIVIASPTANTASMIQVESYKKWILTNLLLQGKVPSMPRGTVTQASKHYRAIAKAYETLAEAFANPDPSKLYVEIQAGQDVWQNDCNTGLVYQVYSIHRQFAIASLSNIYASLPLSRVAALTSLKSSLPTEVYEYVAGLIAAGGLKATLSPPSSSSTSLPETKDPFSFILRFVSDTPSADQNMSGKSKGTVDYEKTTYAELVRQRERMEVLNQHVREAQRKLELSKEYLDVEKKLRKNEAKSAVWGSPGVGRELDEAHLEELLQET